LTHINTIASSPPERMSESATPARIPDRDPNSQASVSAGHAPMMTTREPRYSLPLTDAEIPWFLSAARGPVIVEATMDGCVPCRLQRPVVEKLAAEFSGRLTAVALDPDALQFHRAYRVDRFPQLLLFRDGRYVDRLIGFEGAGKVRDAVAGFLGLVPSGEPSAAELLFRAASARAEARFDEIMRPASAALGPHLAAVAPEVAAFERAIDADLACGRLRREDAADRRRAEYARVYAPFRAEVEALRHAQAQALAAYDTTMAEAVAEFARALPVGGAGATSCPPGQPFCA
jgi:thioredoxin-like negative regulator of GroEL